jgi:hypothetical protein
MTGLVPATKASVNICSRVGEYEWKAGADGRSEVTEWLSAEDGVTFQRGNVSESFRLAEEGKKSCEIRHDYVYCVMLCVQNISANIDYDPTENSLRKCVEMMLQLLLLLFV